MAGVKWRFLEEALQKNTVNILGTGKMHMLAMSCKSTCSKEVTVSEQ